MRNLKVLIVNSCEEFIMVLANIGHVRFSMVNSKHWYCRCLLLIKIYSPPRIVFTFHENLLDEKLPEIKRTFLFFWNLKPLVSCYKMNYKFALFLFPWYLLTDAWLLGTRIFHFPVNLKLDAENRLPNKPSEKWSSECTSLEWEANWWKLSDFYAFNNINISPVSG